MGEIRPLDIVRTKNGDVGIVKEVSTFIAQGGKKCYKASVEWCKRSNETMVAWWGSDEIEIMDNVPDLLSRAMRHPMGAGARLPYGEKR